MIVSYKIFWKIILLLKPRTRYYMYTYTYIKNISPYAHQIFLTSENSRLTLSFFYEYNTNISNKIIILHTTKANPHCISSHIILV